MNVMLLLLVLGPVLFALAALLAPENRRKFVIVAATVFTAAVGLLLGMMVHFNMLDVKNVTLGDGWSTLSVILEFGIIAVVLGIAVRIRNVVIILLALAQVALALVGLIMTKPEHATSEPTFIVDSLGTILVLVVTVIGSAIVYYAIGYMKQHKHHAPPTAASDGRFFFYLIGFLGMMNGLVLANDLKWLAFFWEATTLCSFMLIGQDRTPEANRNAARALLLNSLGGLAMTGASVLAVAGGAGETLTGVMAAKSVALIPMALLCLAAFTKSAQMPFQSWLLGAMVAPTPVSALLHSATMVKAGSYLVLRLAPAFAGTTLSHVVAIVGAFTFAMTSALAVGQSNGKKVLAYSTIANLGLIVACAGINTPLAYAAALMILCFHAASKGLLFLCMGTIEQSIGSRDIEDMGGILYQMPYTTVITMIGMVSMLVPPFGMLLSKWMAMESAVQTPVVMGLIIVGSAFTVLFWAKWLGRIQTVSYHEKYTLEKIPASMFWTMGGLASIVVLAGAAAVPIYRNIIGHLPQKVYEGIITDPRHWALLESAGNFIMWPLFVFPIAAMILAYLSFRKFKASNVRLPFLCGENIEGTVPTYTFRSIADKGETAWSASYYMRNVFTEPRVTFWCNLISVFMLLAMFGVIVN